MALGLGPGSDSDGFWTERRDVWIWTTNGERCGNLKPGYGASEKVLGPELGFGEVIGENIDEQVLLIKTCWGGRSVKRDFLPPSAKLPPDDVLQAELEGAKKRKPETTLADVKARYGKAFGRGMLELLGKKPAPPAAPKDAKKEPQK